jgi:hypothetical protein
LVSDVEAIPRLNYPMVVPLVTFSKKPLFPGTVIHLPRFVVHHSLLNGFVLYASFMVPGITGVSGPMTAELDKVVRANYEKNNPFVGCFLLKVIFRLQPI